MGLGRSDSCHTLLADGLLEVRPGIGTVVAARPPATAADRAHLLKHELEQLVVEAKKVGLSMDEVTRALAAHWTGLDRRRR